MPCPCHAISCPVRTPHRDHSGHGSVVWADNIKTRIQEKLPEPRTSTEPAPSYIQNVIRLHRDGGLRGFFRGSGPIIVRAFPCNAVTFWTYEMAKPLLLPQTGGEDTE